MENAWQLFLRQLGSADLEFTHDNVCGWRADEFEALTGAGLISETAPATHVICDACPEAHWERVRWSEEGARAFIPCPTCGTVDVNPERLRRWKIEVGRLAILLADALDLRREPQPLAVVGWLWRLGRRRFGGRFRDLFFSVSPEDELSAAISKAKQQLSSGSGLLIAPSDARVDSSCEPSRLKVVVLSDVATWKSGKIVLDLELINDIFLHDGAGGRKSNVISLSVPDGALWKDVLIAVGDAGLTIKIGDYQKERSFHDAGFGGRDQRLETLKLLAAGRGKLEADRLPKPPRTPIKNRINALRELLQELIPIDGSPVEYNKRAVLYVCKFQIRLEGAGSFPTPAGTSWLDFRFVARRDGRLAVSVNEKKMFRAHQVDRASGQRIHEVAEEMEAVPRIFSFEEIGLRNNRGKLTGEGAVLVELIRGEGKLNRRGDDMAVLNLTAWLRKWTGLNGDPLQYIGKNQLWSASFECSIEREG